MKKLFKNKLFYFISLPILILIIVVIVLINLMNNKPLNLNYNDQEILEKLEIKIPKQKYYKKIVNITNNTGSTQKMNIIINNTNLYSYNTKFIYFLYDEKDNLVKTGILHDEINNIIGKVSIKANSSEKYRLEIKTLSNNSFKFNSNILINKSNNEEYSILRYMDAEYNYLSDQMKILANGHKLNYGDKDNNIKGIKIVDSIDDKYKNEKYIVSTKESSKPIYMWYEDNTIFFYSENKISLPENSYSLFSNLGSLTDIDDFKYFNTTSVKDFSSMFNGDSNLSNINALSYWDTSNATSFNYMFSGAEMLTDITPLAGFNTSKAKSLSKMFDRTNISNLDGLKYWNVENVDSMDGLFSSTNVVSVSALANWNTKSVKTMYDMFSSSSLSTTTGMEKWDTSQLENIGFMFSYTKIKDVKGLSKWNTSKLKSIQYAFDYCIHLKDISGLSEWDTSLVENMSSAFYETRIENVNALTNWDTTNLKNMEKMFGGARKLNDISGLKNFDTSNVKSFKELFYKTSFKDSTPLKDWDTSSVTDMTSVFSHSKIEKLNGINNWNIDSVLNFSKAFDKTPNRPSWNGSWLTDGTFVKNSK